METNLTWSNNVGTYNFYNNLISSQPVQNDRFIDEQYSLLQKRSLLQEKKDIECDEINLAKEEFLKNMRGEE
jgi:hypothetical protein